MTSYILFLFFTIICNVFSGQTSQYSPLSDEFIDEINIKTSTWKAGRNFPQNTSQKFIENLMGIRRNNAQSIQFDQKIFENDDIIDNLPENFDARKQWPNCPTINEIRDQGSCGACWAVVSTGAMSDRYCIHSKGTKHFRFSAEDVISCCSLCGYGCEGGYSGTGWKYWRMRGIVSGGPYGSNQGCQPFLIPPCEHNVNGTRPPCGKKVKTPECVETCREGYKISYTDDKHFGLSPYVILNNETLVRMEILKNGPVEALLSVYEDFLSYKEGVYQHVQGNHLGEHAVRILGWGIENNLNYWLIGNTWNTDWGDNGYFKIIRGENHCNIEVQITAGIPQYPTNSDQYECQHENSNFIKQMH